MTAYDPALHATARQLRIVGYPVPANIPDHAFIPRAAVNPNIVPDDGGGAKGRAFAENFQAPFRTEDL